MNGGKRQRSRTSQNASDIDENLCPNVSKRMKIGSDVPQKPKTLSESDAELLLENPTIPEDDMGLLAINEEDSYTTASEIDTTSSADIEVAAEEFDFLEDRGVDTGKAATDKFDFMVETMGIRGNDDNGSPILKKLVTPEHKAEKFVLSRRSHHYTGKNQFLRLSDEMILMVFRWLPKPMLCRAALVCKQWRQIAYDDTLWTRLDLGGRSLRARNIEPILKRGVTTLRLAGAALPDPVIKPSSSYLPTNFMSRLQFLDLSMAQISITGLYELLRRCRNLRKLSLENCKVDAAICEAVGHNASLDALNLCSTSGLTASGLEAILACCTSLLSLNLAWSKMSVETIETLTTTLSKSVQRLNVSGCRKNLTDEHVKKIVEACPDLVELDLSDCTVITGDCITKISKELRGLEHLSLSRCYAVTPVDFEKLNDAPKIQYLDMFGVLNDGTINMLKLKLPSMCINKFYFSSVARPTVGVRRTSIWGIRVRD